MYMCVHKNNVCVQKQRSAGGNCRQNSQQLVPAFHQLCTAGYLIDAADALCLPGPESAGAAVLKK